MADQDQDQQAPASRSSEFQGGIVGGGSTHIASALPQVQQASAPFHSDNNMNAIPNELPTGNSQSASTFQNDLFPLNAKSSPLVKAQQETAKEGE